MVQLPVSNHLDLLTPGAAGWGAKRQSLQLQERAAPSRDHGERGGVLAFLCENSSRKVGAAAPGALHQNRGPCALVPWAAAYLGQQTRVSRASCCHRCRLLATAHPEQVPPEEDRHWSPEYLVFSQAFNNASMTFTCRGKD